METRANYVIVGAFTLILILLAFGFIYWTSGGVDQQNRAEVQFQMTGSASGLARGSAVTFNGVRVGTVTAVFIDPDRPDVALANAEIDTGTPITRSTRAVVGIAGLTGTSNIELSGGSATEPNLINQSVQQNQVPVIEVQPSQLTTLLDNAETILTRANTIVGNLENVSSELQQPLIRSAQNITTFTEALANNSGGIESFLSSAGDLATTLQGVSGRLNSTLGAAENLLTAIDAQQINDVVGNTQQLTANLEAASQQLGSVLASADTAAGDLVSLIETANSTATSAQSIVQSIEPETVGNAINNISRASQNIASLAQTAETRANEILASVNGDQIGNIVSNVETLSNTLNQAGQQVPGVIDTISQTAGNLRTLSVAANNAAENVNTILGAVEPEQIGRTINNLSTASQSVAGAAQNVATLAENAGPRVDSLLDAVDPDQVRRIVGNVDTIAGNVGQASGQFPQIVSGLQTTTSNLAVVSERAEAISEGIDPQIIGETVNNISGASQNVARAAQNVSTLTENANGRVNELLATVDADRIDRILGNVDQLSTNLNDAGQRLPSAVENFDQLTQEARAITGPAVNTLRNVDSFVQALDSERVNATVSNIARASEQISDLVNNLSENDNIEATVANLRQTSDRLLVASDRANEILVNVQDFVGDVQSGSGSGVVNDVQQTLASIRQLSENLNERVGPLTSGINNLTAGSLSELQTLSSQLTKSVRQIERGFSELSRNPQRVLTGGTGEVETYDGRNRR